VVFDSEKKLMAIMGKAPHFLLQGSVAFCLFCTFFDSTLLLNSKLDKPWSLARPIRKSPEVEMLIRLFLLFSFGCGASSFLSGSEAEIILDLLHRVDQKLDTHYDSLTNKMNLMNETINARLDVVDQKLDAYYDSLTNDIRSMNNSVNLMNETINALNKTLLNEFTLLGGKLDYHKQFTNSVSEYLKNVTSPYTLKITTTTMTKQSSVSNSEDSRASTSSTSSDEYTHVTKSGIYLESGSVGKAGGLMAAHLKTINQLTPGEGIEACPNLDTAIIRGCPSGSSHLLNITNHETLNVGDEIACSGMVSSRNQSQGYLQHTWNGKVIGLFEHPLFNPPWFGTPAGIPQGSFLATGGQELGASGGLCLSERGSFVGMAVAYKIPLPHLVIILPARVIVECLHSHFDSLSTPRSCAFEDKILNFPRCPHSNLTRSESVCPFN
jgi:hypothetical protein